MIFTCMQISCHIQTSAICRYHTPSYAFHKAYVLKCTKKYLFTNVCGVCDTSFINTMYFANIQYVRLIEILVNLVKCKFESVVSEEIIFVVVLKQNISFKCTDW